MDTPNVRYPIAASSWMIFAVHVLYDYFTAGSDDEAAAMLDMVAGPAGSAPASTEVAEALLHGNRSAIEPLTLPRVRTCPRGWSVLSLDGVDPVVRLGVLEELLTGTPFDTILDRGRHGKPVAIRDTGERLVLTMTDEFRDLMATVDPHRLDTAVAAWALSEEFDGEADPSALRNAATELTRLARQAVGAGHRLYCWICV